MYEFNKDNVKKINGGYKFEVHLATNEELERVKKGYDNIIDKICETVVHDKDLLYYQATVKEQKRRIEILTDIICEIRKITKGKVITFDGKNYHPAKNLTKQEVYEAFVKIEESVKGNYVFLENEKFINELLER